MDIYYEVTFEALGGRIRKTVGIVAPDEGTATVWARLSLFPKTRLASLVPKMPWYVSEVEPIDVVD